MLELIAAPAAGGFTTAELAARLGISRATCHAIATRLAEAGYLVRDAVSKRYSVGAGLVALGKAAEAALAPPAVAAVELRSLREALGCSCTLRTVAGSEMVVLAMEGPAGTGVVEHIGDRYPFAPPLGLSFIAWRSDAVRAEWLARSPLAPRPADLRSLSRAVRSARRRGWIAYGRPSPARWALFSALLGAHEIDLASESVQRMLREVFQSLWIHAVEVEGLTSDMVTDVTLVTAPVFDAAGEARWVLEANALSASLTAGDVQRYGEAVAAAARRVTAATGGVDPFA